MPAPRIPKFCPFCAQAYHNPCPEAEAEHAEEEAVKEEQVEAAQENVETVVLEVHEEHTPEPPQPPQMPQIPAVASEFEPEHVGAKFEEQTPQRPAFETAGQSSVGACMGLGAPMMVPVRVSARFGAFICCKRGAY